MRTRKMRKVTPRHFISQAMMAVFTDRARELRRSYNSAYQERYGCSPLSCTKTLQRKTRDSTVWKRLDRDCVSEQMSALQSIRESYPRVLSEALRAGKIPFLSPSINLRILRVALVSGRPLDSGLLGLPAMSKPVLSAAQQEAS